MNKTGYVLFFFSILFLCSNALGQDSLIVKKIDSLNTIPYAVKISNPSLNVKIYENVLKEASRNKYPKGIADAYSSLALISYYQGNFYKHTLYSLKAIEWHHKLREYKKLCSDYAEYGYQLKKRNRKQATFYMQKGKKIAEERKYTFELGGIYDNYGVIKEMNNELDSALYFYQKALRIKESINDSNGIPYSWNNIAGIFLFQKKYAMAKQFLDKAYQNRLVRKDSFGMAENLALYGNYFKIKGNFKEAIAYYQQTIIICKKNDYKSLEISSYQEITSLYEDLKQPNLALQYLKKYNQLNDSVNSLKLQQDQIALDVAFQTQEKEKVLLETKANVAQKNVYLMGVIALFLSSILIGYLVYFRQKSKTLHLEQEIKLQVALAEVQVYNKLQEQRISISRDLHDNIGSQLTFIISSIENIKYYIGDQNDKVFSRLSKISHFTKDTITELRDTIWAMNKDAISIEDLVGRVSNLINQAKNASENSEIEFINGIPENYKKEFTSKEGIYIYRILQEGLNNAIKYAEATKITIQFSVISQNIQISIADNGIGFDVENSISGNGLANMSKRADEIAATLQLISNVGVGTTWKLDIA